MAVWGSVLLITTPEEVSISPSLRLPIIPISLVPRIAGAVLGFRLLELIPVAGLIMYRLASGTLPDAPQVILTVLSLAGACGLTRALIDDLSLHWPRVFYRSPLAAIAFLPAVTGAVGARVGMGADKASIIGTAVILSLFPLYFSFVSTQGPIMATITVPSLTSVSFRRTVAAATALAGIGSFVGYLYLAIPLVPALASALAVSATAGLCLAWMWGGNIVRAFALFLSISVLVGLFAGIIGAVQSLRAASVILGFTVVISACAVLRICHVRDDHLSKLLSRQPGL